MAFASSAETDMLSTRGLYEDIASQTVVPEALEYTPAYPLWSDGVTKRRWLLLPEGEQVDTSDQEHWDFPVGTKVFKEFGLDGKPLETRLIERVAKTGRLKEDFAMSTFVWSEDLSDATLVRDGVLNVNGTDHDVPAQKYCIVCHRGEPSAVLGFSAVQLSIRRELRKVIDRELLSDPPRRSFAIPGTKKERRALGVLHGSCGHCHSAEGVAEFMRLRMLPQEADLEVEELQAYRSLVDRAVSDEWEDRPERFEYRVVAGEPDASAIVYRMRQRGQHDEPVPDQMPPLATMKVDDEGVQAVADWIADLRHQGGFPPDGGVSDRDGGP